MSDKNHATLPANVNTFNALTSYEQVQLCWPSWLIRQIGDLINILNFESNVDHVICKCTWFSLLINLFALFSKVVSCSKNLTNIFLAIIVLFVLLFIYRKKVAQSVICYQHKKFLFYQFILNNVMNENFILETTIDKRELALSWKIYFSPLKQFNVIFISM